MTTCLTLTITYCIFALNIFKFILICSHLDRCSGSTQEEPLMGFRLKISAAGSWILDRVFSRSLCRFLACSLVNTNLPVEQNQSGVGPPNHSFH